MKTSNKLLTAAFVIIVILMTSSTLIVKKELSKGNFIREKPSVEQNDSLKNDSSSIKIHIN